MLSVANPPGPPCSSNLLDQGSDERDHPPERPSSPEADLSADLDDATLTHFSIRDYVLASRSKDVGTNWPFPQQYLQLCLKHGVRDLLPPFESPDLVRAQYNGECVETDYPVVRSEVGAARTEVDIDGIDCTDLSDGVSDALNQDFTPPSHEPVSGSSRQGPKPLLEEKSPVVPLVGSEGETLHGEDELKVTRHDHTRSIPNLFREDPASLQETRSASESSLVEAAKPHLAGKIEYSCEASVKKCRLIVKLSRTVPEPSQTEDIVANFSSVSDPMSLKVCPVCKTFSSTSITALNAHIDQCLSAESTTESVLIKLSQPKVKPRKKRSMEEIYATAPHCTLEDLDRRNGTNWVMDSTSTAKNNEASCTIETKRPRISFPKATDVEGEGAVYVDSNGTKLLILSKFNGAPPPAATTDCSGGKQLGQESRDERASPWDKKNFLSPKYKKYWKAKVQRKKMSSFNHLKGKIHKESKFHVGTQNEKEKVSQASKAQEPLKVDKPATLGQWICAKRSSLLKHLNSKFRHRKPRNPLAITHVTSRECCDQSASCDYYARGGCAKRCCKSPEELLSSSKSRSTGMLSNAVPAAGSQEENSANFPEKNARPMGKNSSPSNGIELKLSESRDDCMSSTKSKRVGMHAKVVQKTGKFQNSTKTPVACHPQEQKAEKGSRKSLLGYGPRYPIKATKCNEVLPREVTKKLRKHRFAEKVRKTLESIPLESVERFLDSPGAHDLGSASKDVASGMHQSNFSENIEMLRTGDSIDLVLPSQSSIMDSNQAEVNSLTSEGRAYLTLNHSQLGAECLSAEVIKSDVQTVSANIESVSKCSIEKPVGPCGSEVATSEDHKASTCDRLDSCVSLEHPREPGDENEAAVIAGISKLPGDQGVHSLVISSNVISQDVWQVDQMGLDVKDDYCSEPQNLEYQAHIAYIQGFTACLTGFRDEVLEPSKSSSAHIHSNIVEGESSDSPVSAASTISNLSMGDLNSKDADRESSEEAVIIQGKLRPYSTDLGLPEDESVRGIGRTDSEKATQEVKAVASAQEPEKFCDVQPCCCSRGKSISRKPRISRQSMMAGRVVPTQTEQMTSSLYMRPALPPFGGYSHSSSEAVAVPILDSSTDSISPGLSPDNALGFPTSGTFGSVGSSSQIQPQTTTCPILRLMGKNLKVMNREDMPAQHQSRASPRSPDDASNVNYTSLRGFYSACNLSRQDDIRYHHHPSLDGSMLGVQRPSNFQAAGPLHAEQMGSFAGTLLQSELRLKADSHGHQNRMDREPNSSGVNNSEKASPCERREPIIVTQPSFPEREVMVIDDSPEHEAELSGSMQNPANTKSPTFSGLDVQLVRPFCYPPQNLFQSRELGCGLKPAFSISCPRSNTSSTKWGSISESLDPHPPRPFVFPSLSTGHLARTLYYSPSFQ